MDEEKKGKPKKRRYYAVAARGIVYRYEMVDDIFFWSTLSAVLLFEDYQQKRKHKKTSQCLLPEGFGFRASARLDEVSLPYAGIIRIKY